MKKNYLFAVAVVATALAGCSQDELVGFSPEVKSDFTATMETVESRTALDANNKVQWVVNDDHVSLFEKVDINAKWQVSKVDENGTAKLSHVSSIEKADYQSLDKYYAVYPYDDANTIGTDGTITAPVAATYTYKDKESCIVSALMVARSDSKSLRFTNAQGIIRLKLNAATPYTWGKIQSITFTSKANRLSGTATMSWEGTETPVAVIDTEASGKGQSLTIELDESLKQDLPSKQSGEYAEFYVPVVPTTFAAEDLTMVVTFADEKTYTKIIPAKFTIARKEIVTLRHTIGSEDFSADIEDEVVSDEISNEAQLIKALQAGGEITLVENITLTKTANIPADVAVTLDLNGKTLTGSILAPNAELTIENGTFNNENSDVSTIEINAGKLTLDNVTIKSARHAVRIDGNVTATINGGTYELEPTSGKTQHAVNVSGNANVTINGGNFIGPKGTSADSGAAVNAQAGSTVNINGGNFSGGKNNTLSGEGTLTVLGGTFDQNPSAYVAEGYFASTNADGTYTVTKGTVVSDADGFIAAISEVNGGTIALGSNITITKEVEIPAGKTITLNLNGKTISAGYQEDSTEKHIYPINNKGNLTITGGTIEGRGIYNQDGATLTINGATVKALDYNGGACVWSYGTGEVYLNNATMIGNTGVVSSEGYLEINGGTYTCYSGISEDGTQITAPTYNIRAYNGLKITDGTFTSRHGVISVGGGEAVIEGGSYTLLFASATTSNVVYVYGSTDMTINGGEFISDNTSGKADSGAAVLVSGDAAKASIYDGTFIGMNGMVSGNATLYGGTYNTVWDYNHYDKLESLLAEGYTATLNTDGSWTVSKTE